jgi:transcriptional regulator with XRE-family HTH domain
MIKNEKQYQVTRSRLQDFGEALEQLMHNTDLEELQKRLHVNAIESQVESFKREMLEYEELKKGSVSIIPIDSIASIPEVLIQARISKGWTHAELADELELKAQQIQRYESSDYSAASLARIQEVATALDIRMLPTRFVLKSETPPELDDYSPEEVTLSYQKLCRKKIVRMVNANI